MGRRVEALSRGALVMVTVVAILGAHVAVTSAHRCYVCVPKSGGSVADVQAMFPGQIPLLKCADFDLQDSRFVKDCPAESNGCLTQTNGSHVTRTCGDLPVNDCKMANNIQYCYCSDNLCNFQHPARSQHPSHPPQPSDDEDLTHEGSGSGDEIQHPHNHPGGKMTTITPMTATPVTTATTMVKSGTTAMGPNTNVVFVTCVLVVYGVLVIRQ